MKALTITLRMERCRRTRLLPLTALSTSLTATVYAQVLLTEFPLHMHQQDLPAARIQSHHREEQLLRQAVQLTAATEPAQPQQPTCNSCTISSSSLKNAIIGSESFSASASALTGTIKSQCPGITVRIYGDSTSDKRPGMFVSGFSGGTTNSCSTVTITLAQ